MSKRIAPLLAILISSGLGFAQTPKKVLFDHLGWEDGGVSAYWIIDTHEPDPSPANPSVETDWNGGISCWAFDLLKKGYTVQTLPATGGRITYGDTTNPQDLKNYAVYVIPECYRYFTVAEKQAIVSFVQGGGGLFLQGNHQGATRVTSSHPGSTDAFSVFNDLLANEASGFGFTFVVGHGPSDANANTTTTAMTPGTSPLETALTHGPNGLMTAMDFHSFAYLNLTGSNAAAKWIVQTQVSGDPATDYFVVASTYGAGRVVAIGDSSPGDDGTTTTSGKSLVDGYHSNSNKAFHLNAVDWLASASAPANTVTASITTPSGNVTIASGASQPFAGSATDSSTTATLSYTWNFGDGSTAAGASASHTYTNSGTAAVTYTATFKATDNTGASGTATRVITVNPATSGGGTFTEVESNNTIGTANAVAASYTAITGNLPTTTDVDYFALTLQPGQKIAIAMTGPTGPDWDLYLKNSAGTTLASSTGSTTTENLSYTNTGTTAMTVYPEVLVYATASTSPYTLALTYSGGGSGDTTPPTVSASESGTSGTITLSATASDNVGVTKVEFYVDGVLKGTDTTSPYSLALDSTTLSNASHTLVAKAYDAAGNAGTSASVSFTISNSTSGSSFSENFDTGTKTSYAVGNVGFASGTWTLDDALLGNTTSDPHNGVQSIRTRNSGQITMLFDFATGAKTVSLKAGSYGTDGATTWGLWYSTNGGGTWTQAGSSVTTSASTLSMSTFTVNATGAIRFQIRKTDGTTNRVNFDDFQIAGY